MCNGRQWSPSYDHMYGSRQWLYSHVCDYHSDTIQRIVAVGDYVITTVYGVRTHGENINAIRPYVW